jgi:glycine betaine/choline ABC-type transport system substrate-binding protein
MRPALTSLGLIIAILVPSTGHAETAQPLVRVGSKAFTESVVLGEVLEHLIADGGGRPEHRATSTATSNTQEPFNRKSCRASQFEAMNRCERRWSSEA